MATDTGEVKCRHCGEAVKPCDCGAADGQRHWLGPNGIRWCPGHGQQAHAREVTTDG